MNLLTNVPNEVSARILFYFEGTRLGEIRRVSKKVRDIIDRNTCLLFKACTFHEFTQAYNSYNTVFPSRTDWKNIYMISVHCKNAEIVAARHRKCIQFRQTFKRVEMIISLFENTLNFISGILGITTMTTFGFSASRAAIKAFLAANPHLSRVDAYKALGLIAKDYVQITF